MAFSVVDGILLRGAISLGPLTVVLNQWPSQTHSFQHSLFGKAIVDAVQAEKEQDWAGCVVTRAAVEHYKASFSGGESLIDKKVILQYPVPGKGDKEVTAYVIDWVNHPQAGIDFQTVTGTFASSPILNPSEFENIKKKIANTLKFVKYVKPSADQPRVLGQFAF
jgi:hypothetical protein